MPKAKNVRVFGIDTEDDTMSAVALAVTRKLEEHPNLDFVDVLRDLGGEGCLLVLARPETPESQEPLIPPAALEAAVKLRSLRLGAFPSAVRAEAKKQGFYEAEDEKQPFFSEAYLYTLLGKEDARTVLALWKRVVTALGMTP
jgi:hypothetical protein